MFYILGQWNLNVVYVGIEVFAHSWWLLIHMRRENADVNEELTTTTADLH